jgi:hypothetical protein
MKTTTTRARQASCRLRRAALAGLLLGAALAACTTTEKPATPPAAPHTAQAAVRPWPVDFGYGCNLGYYGPTWPDEQLARAVHAAGGNTLRVSLPEQFLVQWGWDARRAAFAYYKDSLHLRDLVCFVGEPSPAHRDPIIITPSTSTSSRSATARTFGCGRWSMSPTLSTVPLIRSG